MPDFNSVSIKNFLAGIGALLASILGSLKIGEVVKAKAEARSIKQDSDVNALKETVKALESSLETLQQTLLDSDKRGDARADRLEMIEQRLSAALDTERELKDKVARLESQMKLRDAENHGLQLQISELKIALEKANRKISSLQNELDRKEGQINELKRNPPGCRELAK